jgi:sulfonate transport system ATP-binding protein
MQDLVAELRRVHRPAVLLVTHDVDEAVRLADRVAVLRAGQLVTDERITVGGPRDLADPQLAPLRRKLLADLGVSPDRRDSTERTDQPVNEAIS